MKSDSKENNENEIRLECPSCGDYSWIRDYQQNNLVCGNCGLVLREGIKDRGPEWRAFDQQQRENKSRAGPPSTNTIHDKGLSTQIDYKNRDAKGNKLSPEKRRQMYRLKKWHKRSRITDSKDRNLSFALSEMDRMASQLGLPRNIRESTSRIYRQAVQKGLIRGRSIEGVLSATLYAACRKNQVPRSLEEIAEVSRVDKSEISKSYRFISRELNLHLSPTDPSNYVARFGSELGISNEVKIKAMEIIKRAQKEKLTSGKSPTGTAAAAIYIAALKGGERKTQRETAEVADVTEVTIRNRYKEIVEQLDVRVDP